MYNQNSPESSCQTSCTNNQSSPPESTYNTPSGCSVLSSEERVVMQDLLNEVNRKVMLAKTSIAANGHRGRQTILKRTIQRGVLTRLLKETK